MHVSHFFVHGNRGRSEQSLTDTLKLVAPKNHLKLWR